MTSEVNRRDFIVRAAAVVASITQLGCDRPASAAGSPDKVGSELKKRVFITGSSSGLGLLAGKMLAKQGHEVVLHARNTKRAEDTRAELPAARAVVIGDVSTLAVIRSVADQVNAFGQFDAVIHNVAIGNREPARVQTRDGLSQLFAVNVVAPYLLTACITAPERLIYLSSGMHHGGDPSLEDLQWNKRPWNGSQAYSDSKLHCMMLAMAVARRWPNVRSNAVNPGWVPTRMGGPNAPDDLDQGASTQVWLAVSEDRAAQVTGHNFHHFLATASNPAAGQQEQQELLLDKLRRITGAQIG